MSSTRLNRNSIDERILALQRENQSREEDPLLPRHQKLSAKYYTNTKFIQRYNPNYFLQQRNRQTYLSVVFCLVCIFFICIVIFCGGLFLLLFGLMERTRNISRYNLNIESWNKKYRSEFCGSSDEYYSYTYKYYGEERKLKMNSTQDYIHDSDKYANKVYSIIKYGDNTSSLVWNEVFSRKKMKVSVIGETVIGELYVDMFVEENWKSTFDICGDNHGDFDYKSDICYRYWMIDSVCIVVESPSSMGNINKLRGGYHGCYKGRNNPVNKNRYYSASYKMIKRKRDDYETKYNHNGTVMIRSFRDPYLLLYDNTNGKLDFGTDFGPSFWSGNALIAFSIFTVFCLCCCYIGLPKSKLDPFQQNETEEKKYSVVINRSHSK